MTQTTLTVFQNLLCISPLVICYLSPSVAYLIGRRIARRRPKWPPPWIRAIHRLVVGHLLVLTIYLAWSLGFDMLIRFRSIGWWELLLVLPLPFAIFFGPAVATAVILSARDAVALPRQNICINCEYDLTGNVSGICPECGEKIEPRDQAESS